MLAEAISYPGTISNRQDHNLKENPRWATWIRVYTAGLYSSLATHPSELLLRVVDIYPQVRRDCFR